MHGASASRGGGCDNIPARARIIHPMWAAEDGSIARDCSREWVKLQQPTNDTWQDVNWVAAVGLI